MHGERTDGSWSLDQPLEGLSELSVRGAAYGFYGLSLRAPHAFPRQFVLRLSCKDGQLVYDNHAGANYRLQPFGGRGLSAIRRDGILFDFGDIIRCRLYAR